MKKQLFMTVMLFVASWVFSQAPTDYVARYEFNNSINNSVSGGTALTTSNGNYAFVNDRDGQANAAIDFNGTAMSGHIFSATSSNPVNSFSVSVWLKLNPGTPGGARGIVSLYATTSNSKRFIIARERNNNLLFLFRTEEGTEARVSQIMANLYDGKWHNIVVTLGKNGANFDATVYVDGTKHNNLSSALDFQQANSNDNFLESNTVLELARIGVGSEQYSSAMDDLMLFDRAITESEASDIGLNIVYVNENATGANDGSSWANAFTSLKTAITNTRHISELWVAKGTYYVPATDVNVGFIIDKSVKIYGGFNGTETQRNQRDYKTNKTVLSGDIQKNDNLSNFPFAANEASRTDNARTIVRIKENNIVLDGVTVSGGHSPGSWSGIAVDANITAFTVINSEIAYNYSRGASAGVGAIVSTTSTYVINNNHFHHNSSNKGTGVYLVTGAAISLNIEMASNLFNNNRIVRAGTTFSGSAGWIRSAANYSRIRLNFVNNTVVNNYTDDSINAVFGISRYLKSSLETQFHNNIFWGNRAATTTPKAVHKINGFSVGRMIVSQKNISEDGRIASVIVPRNNPLFTDVANGDFTLRATSPAIDKGDNTKIPTRVTADVFGLKRIHNVKVDLGAHEYGSASMLSTDKITDTLVSVRLYPNPTSSSLTIANVEGFKSAVVYSILGKQVLKSVSKTLNVSQLTSGVYVVKIENALGKVCTKKFVKQ